jgi:hypothetical protein
MTNERLRIVFWVDALVTAIAGVLLALGTWDGLYNALDLPQAKPAIWTQVAGAFMLGVAYALWLATRTPALMLPLARAGAIISGLSTGVIVAWLVKGGLGIGTQGKAELGVMAAGLALLTVLYLMAGVRTGGYGPEPPPPPDAP